MTPDFLVVGAGVAGLRAAIELAEAGTVMVVAKDRLQESSSEYAQGGIAAALNDDDEVELHEQDTLDAGDGLCDPAAVRVLVEEGTHAIQELIEWGAAFDREGGRLMFGREGAHSRSRILHARGDSTGQEIARALLEQARTYANIEFRSFSAVTDLLLADGEAAGAVAYDERSRGEAHIRARAVLLATGGLGRVYLDTTNPDVATGDGVATAYRAGAEISDIEFVQFHPTALHVEGAPRFLLSEALRGEGAYLRNAAGERFVQRHHPMAELAPRDVVSRAIMSELRGVVAPHVFLDLRHLDADRVHGHFPRISETCGRFGVDIARDLIPVLPAAHYAMGGVRTDLNGRTSLPRLFAAGEVACTGVHGANRLASNSLLEGVVFGRRAGRAMREAAERGGGAASAPGEACFPSIREETLRRLAWDHAGLLRSAESLRTAIAALEAARMQKIDQPGRHQYELRNMHEVALLISRCALAREESRGGHYRTDFPQKRPEFQKHSRIRSGGAVEFVD
ncbi:MAG: L-aspartate oxidase [Bryobacteraceae bacterium]|nr:L-aspartate oxidase [Bryobacteraceae bacterium]